MNRILGIFAVLGLEPCRWRRPAAAEPANLLGVFGNWSAYSTGSGPA